MSLPALVGIEATNPSSEKKMDMALQELKKRHDSIVDKR